jgi:tetratricopeptide (TPR) repeat protein
MRLAYVDEFQRGIQAFNKGREDESSFSHAVVYFRNTSMIMPDSSAPYVNEAYALINAGRPEEAIEPFEKAMATGETEGDTYLLLADIYQRNERVEDAVGLLEEARTMYPEREDIQSQLLNAYIAAGQVDRAKETYREAVEREPDNKLYRYNYGSLLLQSEDYDGAIEQLTTATNLDPEYSIAFYNLGAAYVNQAVDVNASIQEIDDDLRANRATLSEGDLSEKEAQLDALVEERKGLFEKAIEPLERARELQETAGEEMTATCSALFQSYVQTGEEDKAQDAAQCAGIDLN